MDKVKFESDFFYLSHENLNLIQVFLSKTTIIMTQIVVPSLGVIAGQSCVIGLFGR